MAPGLFGRCFGSVARDPFGRVNSSGRIVCYRDVVGKDLRHRFFAPWVTREVVFTLGCGGGSLGMLAVEMLSIASGFSTRKPIGSSVPGGTRSGGRGLSASKES